jgi:ribonuclease III
VFTDKRILREALTHPGSSERRSGASAVNNQRLEFLGDRVLGLVIAQLLLERYPRAEEGPLTSRSQVLVSTTVLAEIALELDLDRWLAGPETGPGRRSAPSRKMRADICEALIGAMFADGGLAPAAEFIRRLWSGRIEAMTEPPRDPKMALQEWALERGLPLPDYTVEATEGPPHAPVFKVRVTVARLGTAVGEGGSKRRAEQTAARRLLEANAEP